MRADVRLSSELGVSKLLSIDLFAGAGGLTEGLKQAGFVCAYASEFDKDAASTFRLNHPSAYLDTKDVREVEPSSVAGLIGVNPGVLDLVAGGPPCQGYSTYGRRDSDDPRNRLYLQYFRFVEYFLPRAFLIENVMGILSMDDGYVIADIQRIGTELGYAVSIHVANAEDHGVPQRRKRVFVIGIRDGSACEEIKKSHYVVNGRRLQQGILFGECSDDAQAPLTVRDAISDLLTAETCSPDNHDSETEYPTAPLTAYQAAMRLGSVALSQHSTKRMLGVRRLRLALLRPGDYGTKLRERILGEGLPYPVIDEILGGHAHARDLSKCRSEDVEAEGKLRRLLHEGHTDISQILEAIDSGGFANKYRRLHWDEPSHTLVAHMARDCSDFIHPELDRFISVREAARLQSFKDVYRFAGSQFQQLKQIGNAVPPLLGMAIGKAISSALDNRKVTKRRAKTSIGIAA